MAEEPQVEDKEANLTSHLIELRSRIIYMLYGVIAVFIILIPFRNEIYTQFAMPAIESLTLGVSMIIPKPFDAFLIPIKLCFFLSLLINLPWILYQIWAFVAPGLYQNEKKLVLPIVFSSTTLFYIGILFAYYIVLPFLFDYLTKTPVGAELTPSIADYLSMVLTLFIAFGLVFEVPVATIILIIAGVVEVKSIRAKRPYIIVAAFVMGMILTPPDPFTQTLIAVPMLLLLECALYLGSKIEAKRDAEREKDLASGNE